MLVVFVIMAAITIDYSYMQLVRTELRAATDASAKAGAEALGRTQNVVTAKQEAIRYASANNVAGQPFALGMNDIEVGKVVRNSGSGRWDFQLNGTPPNSVRINARTGSNSARASVPLFFGQVLGTTSFSPSYKATAGQQDVEVCLCLDRSGSMLWDMSSNDWSYPPNNPYLSSFTDWGTLWQNYLSAPHPTSSRWAILSTSVRLFLDQAALSSPQPRVSLVTWASNIQMPISPYTIYNESEVNVALPSLSSSNFDANKLSILQGVDAKSAIPMLGGTNLSAGLTQAISVLQGPNSNPFSSKVIVLLTDGAWNLGADPVTVANTAKNAGITIHCVSMLTSSQTTLQQVAALTNGRYYSTSNETQLKAAFEDIARTLPVVLTD